MAILINDTSPRSQYTATSGQTVFSVPFEFFSNADLLVYQNSTLKTLTTHYTVTGAGVTGGGSITLVSGATAGDVITIVRDIPVKRVTDFPTSGPFNVDALNTDLDRLTAMIREREDQVSRVISLAQTDAAVNLYLPTAANRASKVMAFDSTGNVIIAQELGQYRGNWASGTAYILRDIIKDTSNANIYICVAAHTSTGSQPISSNANSASWALLVDAATATSASASASSSASAASSSASAASTSATNAATSATQATTNGAAQVTLAAAQVALATTQATNAATSASTATTQASNASTSATNAASSASAASTSATNAASSATSASNSAASAAAALASGLYSAVIDKSANYTVLLADAGDLIRVTTTSGAVTITLPQISTVTDGFKVAIVKWTGDANAVNIARSGSDTINGATSATIGSQYTQTTFVADFETNQWFAATSGLGSTNVVIDTFNGTGSQTAFTLSGDAGTKNNTFVYVSGVYQAKSTYSLSTTTLTFSTAPPSGTGNIEVIWTQPLAVGTPSDGTITTAKIVDANVTAAKLATDSVTTAKILNSNVTTAKIADANVTLAKLSATGTPSSSNFLRGDNTWAAPTGGFSNIAVATTTAASNSTGTSLVWNSTGNLTWTVPTGVTTCKVTVVGGGGGGGGSGQSAGGGGAGGASIRVVTGLTPSGTVAVTVGAGGGGGSGSGGTGTTGGTSSFGAYASATGGSGGTAVNGGAGGTGSSGNLNISGGLGISGYFEPSLGYGQSGGGGNTLLGGAGKGANNSSSVASAAQSNTGGGGGGGFAAAGTSGGTGVVIIEW